MPWASLGYPETYHQLVDKLCSSFQSLYSSAFYSPAFSKVINFKFPIIASPSMNNLAFDSLLRWKMIVLSILTTSPIHFSLGRLVECTFWTWEWKVRHASVASTGAGRGQHNRRLGLFRHPLSHNRPPPPITTRPCISVIRPSERGVHSEIVILMGRAVLTSPPTGYSSVCPEFDKGGTR